MFFSLPYFIFLLFIFAIQSANLDKIFFMSKFRALIYFTIVWNLLFADARAAIKTACR